jgi:hypothetical protein
MRRLLFVGRHPLGRSRANYALGWFDMAPEAGQSVQPLLSRLQPTPLFATDLSRWYEEASLSLFFEPASAGLSLRL